MEKYGRKDKTRGRETNYCDVDFSLQTISPSPDDFFSLAINMAEATKQFKWSADEATTTEIILSGTCANDTIRVSHLHIAPILMIR
jgi:hypothetical protein